MFENAKDLTLQEKRACLLQEGAGRKFKAQAHGNTSSEGAAEPEGRVQEGTKYSKNRKDLDNY